MKGFVYMLEVLIAIGIVIVSAVIMFRDVPQKAETEISSLKNHGFYALKYLDDTGVLRNYVIQNNESLAENDVKAILPTTVNLEAEICGSTCSDANVPNSKDTVSVDYFISGYRKDYLEKRVKLWIWRK
ncbi:MAG: hypothetical protein QMD85_01295 [Candidatus Aenigmarchaeota archaeon]|nr:hypothetical protein [Candidatus Aenigmarchaeota archaeon]MDI6722187.1 hypothetical protein [Candidatus Aenigmarchaeota archaeon]